MVTLNGMVLYLKHVNLFIHSFKQFMKAVNNHQTPMTYITEEPPG